MRREKGSRKQHQSQRGWQSKRKEVFFHVHINLYFPLLG
jgi:hypothetical protein